LGHHSGVKPRLTPEPQASGLCVHRRDARHPR
jgi:hypothetical protein